MTLRTGTPRLPVITPWLAVFVGVLILSGFVACLACDLDSCCDDADHESDTFCSCVCALQGVPPAGGLVLISANAPGSTSGDGEPAADSAPLPGLYRPPRA